MKFKAKEYIIKRVHDIKFHRSRQLIKNESITIISNNCWGGHCYRDFNMEYSTPFIGLLIISPDYIKLLKSFEHYMNCDLIFIEKSKLDDIKNVKKREYPVGMLDDVELHFIHYKTENEALEKWNRRKERMNWDNLYFKLSEKLYCTPKILEEFDQLPYKNKVIFTKNKYNNLRSAVCFKKFNLNNEMYFYTKYFDIVEWLNYGKIKKK